MYSPIPAFTTSDYVFPEIRLSEDRRLIHNSYVGVQGPFLAAFDFKSLMGVIDKNDKL